MKRLAILAAFFVLAACGSAEHKNLRGQHTGPAPLPVAPVVPVTPTVAPLVKASPDSLLECRGPEGQNYWISCHLVADPMILARGDQNTVRTYKVRSNFDCKMGEERTVAVMPIAVTVNTGDVENVHPLFLNNDEEFEIRGSGDLILKATDVEKLRKYTLGANCSLIVTVQ